MTYFKISSHVAIAAKGNDIAVVPVRRAVKCTNHLLLRRHHLLLSCGNNDPLFRLWQSVRARLTIPRMLLIDYPSQQVTELNTDFNLGYQHAARRARLHCAEIWN
jgi:hypothetical protein